MTGEGAMADDRKDADQADSARPEWALSHIQEALRGLRFGQVTVTVQDGVVVQLERIERKRLPRAGNKS
jgi:hypothetical protein